MISYLRGKIIYKEVEFVVLEVQGVGYKVLVSEQTMSRCVDQGEVELFCHMHQRDSGPTLYGMFSPDELRVFDIITGISGVGPKVALALSSLGTIDALRKAIEERDYSFFDGVKGVGKKRMQKIMLELTGKLEDVVSVGQRQEKDEAAQALANLGFTMRDAREALSQVDQTIDPEERVKEALKVLGGG